MLNKELMDYMVSASLITIVGFSCFYLGLRFDDLTNIKTAFTTKVDQIINIDCSSDSMGMVVDCNDKLYATNVGERTELIEGDVYAFESPYNQNHTVVHRLVKDCSDGCYGYIFKGDNNKVADPLINKTEIRSKIIKVEYGAP